MTSFPVLNLLQDSYDPPVTVELLNDLEVTLGVKLPVEYRDFLRRINGGKFYHPVVFYLPEPTPWIDCIGIYSFLGESRDPLCGQGISFYAELYKGRIPSEYLDVAHCNSIDLILLKLDDTRSDFGTVWFWDGPEEADGDNIYWLADSWNDFLAMLMSEVEEKEEVEQVPVFQAVERGNLKAVEKYLADGGDVDACNAQGRSLLVAAIWYGWPTIARLLLDHSANPNARDADGRTPLHHAAVKSIDCVKLLLAAGADAKARDHAGKSVLGEWSYRADQILRAHGAEEP